MHTLLSYRSFSEKIKEFYQFFPEKLEEGIRMTPEKLIQEAPKEDIDMLVDAEFKQSKAPSHVKRFPGYRTRMRLSSQYPRDNLVCR